MEKRLDPFLLPRLRIGPNLPADMPRDKHAARDDFLCHSAGVSHFRSELSRDIPGGVHLPQYIRQAFDWPG